MEEVLYAWFDTEYSSLDLENSVILQVALIITDGSLKRVLPIETDIDLVIRLPERIEMSPWVKENLPNLEGLCRSADAVDITDADNRLSEYVAAAENVSTNRRKERPVLAGNSIHADWWLSRRFLPNFLDRLHYRHLDVTTFKLEWKRLHRKDFDKENPTNIRKWFPEANLPFAGTHDAYYDVQASIAELAFYRRHLFAKTRKVPQR